jgi:hypothetical protein
MDLTRLLNLFEEKASNIKSKRETDILINTITENFLSNFESLKNFPVLILQWTFMRKKNSSASSLNFTPHYKLLSKILKSILRISNKTNDKNKKKLVKDLIDYSEKSSKSIDKSYREGIANFLKVLKNYNIAEFSALDSKVCTIAKRLIVDKIPHVRHAGVKLAIVYNMKEEIIRVIKTEMNSEVKKTAIDSLVKDDQGEAIDELTKCLEDSNATIKAKALKYFIKEEVHPNSQGIRILFKIIVNDPDKAVKNFAKAIIMKIARVEGTVEMFRWMNLFQDPLKNEETFNNIVLAFSEIYQPEDLEKTIIELFARLQNEKEAMDLESLFALRLSVTLYKSKGLSFQRNILEKVPLDDNFFWTIIPTFLESQSTTGAEYYMKLQNIILITHIDLEENISEALLLQYFEVCKKMPLLKFKNFQDPEKINKVLIEEFDNKLFVSSTFVAVDEQEVISTVIEIAREKFQDAEGQYMTTLSRLLQELIDGVAVEENDRNDLVCPLSLKIEKTDKKIKQTEEALILTKQEKTSQARNEKKDLKNSRNKLENKKNKLIVDTLNKEYRSLLVASFILRYADMTDTIHSEFSMFPQTLFIPKLASENLFISSLALRCLGYSCLLSKDQSKQHIEEFKLRLTSKTDILKALSTVHLFDILLCKKIDEKEVVADLIKCLWIELHSEENRIVQFTLIEGFSKLLLKNIIISPVEIFVKILTVFFDLKTKPDTFNVAQALFRNFVKLSEEKTAELAQAFLVFLLENKNTSSRIQDVKVDKRITLFYSFFDPKREKTYESDDNIQLLFFVFAFMNFENNSRFYAKMMQNLKLEHFNEDEAKYVKNRVLELQRRFKNFNKEFEKILAKLKLGTEVVEDISFREYEKRFEEIVIIAQKINKRENTIVID